MPLNIYRRLSSLNLGLWLMGGLLLFMGAGSVLGEGEGGGINEMSLLAWLREAPFGASWWLWVAMALLSMLALNTVLCSIESLRMKWRRESFLVLIAPQVMHLGFLLIVVAHLFSAYGGFKQSMRVGEGSVIGFPDGELVRVEKLDAAVGPMGMPAAFSAGLRYGPGGERLGSIGPNKPLFHKGYGIYLKDVELYPERFALVEIHREPGAGWALSGALLFTAGNLVLLAARRGR